MRHARVKELFMTRDQESATPPYNGAGFGGSQEVRRERIALYILALDAINFCFWPSDVPYEYVDLATSLTKAAERDHELQQGIVDAAATSSTSPHISDDFAFSAKNLQYSLSSAA